MKTLCIDIGNSNVKIGIFKGMRLMCYAVHDTRAFLRVPAPFLQYKKYGIEKALICSVVAGADVKVAARVRKSLSLKPLIINKTCNVALASRYSKKHQLGNDRIVNIYGALCSISPPFILISCGTAITLDLIDREGVHEGGYIIPGMNMSAEALHTFTAGLPKVKITASRDIMGMDTESAIRLGIIHGIAASIDSLTARLKKTCRGDVTVVATGGDATTMKKYCSSIDRVLKKHTLNALNCIAHSL